MNAQSDVGFFALRPFRFDWSAPMNPARTVDSTGSFPENCRAMFLTMLDVSISTASEYGESSSKRDRKAIAEGMLVALRSIWSASGDALGLPSRLFEDADGVPTERGRHHLARLAERHSQKLDTLAKFCGQVRSRLEIRDWEWLWVAVRRFLRLQIRIS